VCERSAKNEKKIESPSIAARIAVKMYDGG